MKLSLTYDAGIDAWTLRHTDVHLATEEDVATWRQQLAQKLKVLLDKPVYLLIDVEGFDLAPEVAPLYGAVAKRMTERMLAVIRYGKRDGWTAAQVRLQAVINRFTAPVLADRDSAIEALSRLRAQPSPPKRSI